MIAVSLAACNDNTGTDATVNTNDTLGSTGNYRVGRY
jgi:hypothetical protein